MKPVRLKPRVAPKLDSRSKSTDEKLSFNALGNELPQTTPLDNVVPADSRGEVDVEPHRGIVPERGPVDAFEDFQNFDSLIGESIPLVHLDMRDMGESRVADVINSGQLSKFSGLSDTVLEQATPGQKATLLKRALKQKANIWHTLGFNKFHQEPSLTPMVGRLMSTVAHPDQFDQITAKVGVRKLRRFFNHSEHRSMRSQVIARTRNKLVRGKWDKFPKYLERLTGRKPAAATKAELLLDEQVLPKLLKEIKGAKESVDVQLYIFADDDISNQVVDALRDKAKEGVPVRVVLDGFGSKATSDSYRKMFQRMRDDGVDLRFKPPDLLRSHLDHRKIWLFDGKVGYTGGANVGKHYHGEWRDQQTRMEGGAVPQLETLFKEAWARVGGQPGKYDDTVRAAPLKKSEGMVAHVVHHDGNGTDENIKTAYLRAIETSTKSIRIANPYFADKDIVDALASAAERGVEVELVIPRQMDSQLLLDAARMHYGPLIAAGVQVREYTGRMAHHKVAVFDDEVATLGSSNLDTRSLENNDEANVFFTDPAFAAEVRHDFFDAHRAESPLIEDALSVQPKTAVYRYVLRQAMTLL